MHAYDKYLLETAGWMDLRGRKRREPVVVRPRTDNYLTTEAADSSRHFPSDTVLNFWEVRWLLEMPVY